ncbi:MAG: helix-turn-helix transcriptional regulator [Clostridia bacterium]
MDIMSIFSERLSDLMLDNKTTKQMLAVNLGIDITNIRKYLRKTSLPILANAIKIAGFFGCSLDFLFGVDDENYFLQETVLNPFSVNFKAILKAKNCTRYKLNKATKISQQSLDDWYCGKRQPNIENLITLAKYFDCSLDFLVGRSLK